VPPDLTRRDAKFPRHRFSVEKPGRLEIQGRKTPLILRWSLPRFLLQTFFNGTTIGGRKPWLPEAQDLPHRHAPDLTWLLVRGWPMQERLGRGAAALSSTPWCRAAGEWAAVSAFCGALELLAASRVQSLQSMAAMISPEPAAWSSSAMREKSDGDFVSPHLLFDSRESDGAAVDLL